MTDRERHPFLPDFCAPGNLLRTMLIAQLLAIVMVAARPGDLAQRTEALALLSLFIQWVAIVDVALLCALRRWFARLDDRAAAAIAFAMLQVVTIVFTLIAHDFSRRFGLPTGDRPLLIMVLEHATISVIITAVGLRYFYVSAQWQRNVESEAQARVQALQARIRPHFLFNSMNTIASLTRSDPEAAERAVEDLSEVFRGTLSERTMLPLPEELELVASYLRIEQLRLGDRLGVDWAIDEGLDDVLLPALSLQPLVENAVYHGIEQLAGGGRLRICIKADDAGARIRISNPLAVTGSAQAGHRIAQENVRQRLLLAFGERGSFHVDSGEAEYTVTLYIPRAETR